MCFCVVESNPFLFIHAVITIPFHRDCINSTHGFASACLLLVSLKWDALRVIFKAIWVQNQFLFFKSFRIVLSTSNIIFKSNLPSYSLSKAFDLIFIDMKTFKKNPHSCFISLFNVYLNDVISVVSTIAIYRCGTNTVGFLVSPQFQWWQQKVWTFQ